MLCFTPTAPKLIEGLSRYCFMVRKNQKANLPCLKWHYGLPFYLKLGKEGQSQRCVINETTSYINMCLCWTVLFICLLWAVRRYFKFSCCVGGTLVNSPHSKTVLFPVLEPFFLNFALSAQHNCVVLYCFM